MQQPTLLDDTLIGVLERVLFFNQDNHYCVGDFRLDRDGSMIVIAGHLPSVQCGETLKIKGDWTHHPQYGKQFKIQAFEAQLPASVHGIKKYLGSGLVPGIGKLYAQKIVEAFGCDTLRIISEESARLKDIPGIGPSRALAIKKAWDEQKSVRDVMTFLQTYGIGNALCIRLVKAYGDQARQVLEQEPYRVAREVTGIGFKTADQIALNIGFSNEHPPRIDAGILFALEQLEADGHTGAMPSVLAHQASELLQLPEYLVETRIQALLEARELVASVDPHFLQRPACERAESIIASCLSQIMRTPSTVPPILMDKAIDWAQSRAKIAFAPEQRQAIEQALTAKISLVTGGPGTGKTTLLKALVDILKAKNTKIVLASPTGRAAQRMTETTGAFAQTIHRLLKFDPRLGRFFHDEKNPIQADYLIVDETSMLDSRLACALLRAIPLTCQCLWVGDVHQLPSVGAGNVLKDWIDSGYFPVTCLKQVFRQTSRSTIVAVAHGILHGEKKCPVGTVALERIRWDEDFHFIQAVDPQLCLDIILRLIQHDLPKHYGASLLRDIQLLTPMHRGTVGTTAINQAVQSISIPKKQVLMFEGQSFRIGDKVIQTRNHYDKGIFNGDLGQVIDIQDETKK